MHAVMYAKDPHLNINVPLYDWMTPVIHDALATDRYEHPEREMVEAAVRPYDRVVELGAGLGVISSICARVCGNDYVVAYEANPKMIDTILETYKVNGVAPTLRNKVLGDKTGKVPVYIHPDFWQSSLVPDERWLPVTVEFVEMVNGSDALINCTFLICDIEGGEAELFKTISLPASLKKILVETHPRVTGEAALDRMMADFYAAGFILVATGGDVWFLARA